MGGPFVDEGGAMLIVSAEDESEVFEKLRNDPWMKHGLLKLESVKRWEIFIDVASESRQKISSSHCD